MAINLPDVQQSKLGFLSLYINKVGVRNILVPISLSRRNSDKIFNTIATISSYCDLNDSLKGINMSRIGRTIYQYMNLNNNHITGFNSLTTLSKLLQTNHNTSNNFLKMRFKYIMESLTPITKLKTFEPVDVTFEVNMIGELIKHYMTILFTGMALCPCSKEMSLLINNLTESLNQLLSNANVWNLSLGLVNKIRNAGFGAHNQKSDITVKVLIEKNFSDTLWIELIVDVINESVSSPVWSILKREDLKFVTLNSYMGKYIDHNGDMKDGNTNSGPKFVLDISRDIASRVNKISMINDYVIVVDNQLSIHSNEIIATSVINAGKELK